jgi:signal transduction histidine kinase
MLGRAREFLWRFASLRLRVVGAFVVLLSVTLAIAGTQIYVSTKGRLIDEIDLDLGLAASQALLHVEEEDGRYELQDGEVELLAFPGESDLEIRVVSPGGEQWDHAGAQLVVTLPPHAAAYTTEITGQEWRTLSQPIIGPSGEVEGWVQAVRSLRPVDEALSALGAQLYIILPLAVLIAAVASYFVAGRALRPLTRIAGTAGQTGPANLGKRIGHRGPADEVGRMASAFDGMLDRVQDAFERERRFSAEASHELRTPLAAIKSGIGVTLVRKRSKDEYRATLESLDAQVDQLIRLCDDLLVLARGGRPRAADSELVDLTSLLELVAEQLEPVARERGVILRPHIRSRLAVDGFPDDLIRLFLNLVSNAIKFTPPGGKVTLVGRRHHGHINTLISDTGPGIAEEHLPHVFEPFYRMEPSCENGERGTGLGLAIAREITGAHGGSIAVHSLVGAGTTFEVVLPGL